MNYLTGFTSEPKQESTVILADGTRFVWYLEYRPNQAGWFYNINWNETFTLNGQRLVTGPNILRQWENIIPFGIGVIGVGMVDPLRQTDLADGTITLVLLEGADLAAVDALYANPN